MSGANGVKYHKLGAAHGDAWLRLFVAGTRDFPLGFLMTAAEAAALTPERAQDICASGGLRGLFHDEQLIGFCGFRRFQPARIRHRAEIGPFFITAAHHGAGAAQSLMAGVVAEAQAEGVRQLELTVSPLNLRAIRFYERQGFVRYGNHPEAICENGECEEELLYRKVLSPSG